jgi:hypothetical protein
VAQLHRQLGRDLFTGEIVEELQHRSQASTEHKHRAPALQLGSPAGTGVTAIAC